VLETEARIDKKMPLGRKRKFSDEERDLICSFQIEMPDMTFKDIGAKFRETKDGKTNSIGEISEI